MGWEQQPGDMLRGAGDALRSIWQPQPAPAAPAPVPAQPVAAMPQPGGAFEELEAIMRRAGLDPAAIDMANAAAITMMLGGGM